MAKSPSQRFIEPVKTAIRSAIMSFPGGKLDINNVRFDSVERDPSHGATILLSRQIQPSLNRKAELPRGGDTGRRWTADDQSIYTRHLRSSLNAYFDIQIYSPSLAVTTDALFHLVAFLPRNCYDGHLLAGLAVQPADFHGNPVELTAMNPILPDDTVSTAKQYRAMLLVKAEGGIYADIQSLVSVKGVVRPAADFFVAP